MSTPISIIALLIAVLVAYAAGQTDRNALLLKPTLVDADKAFNLEVLSYRWDCGDSYSPIQSARKGDRLEIRFAVTGNPAIDCPAIDKPYGPLVPVQALPEGRYDVWVTPLVPCLVAPQPCDVPEKEERAGILTVGRRAAADWFVSPAATAAGGAFDLRILSEKYGNCQTSFEHKGLEVRQGRIVAAFVVKTDPDLVCIVDIHPHGPAFRVEALPAGKYPVDVIEQPACSYQTPPCPWMPNVIRTVDTLLVSGTASSGPRAEIPSAGARARLERGRVKAEGMRTRTLQGRSLGKDEP